VNALIVHRIQFAFTLTFHYLFPQLTMGLALLIVVLKTLALATGDEHYNDAARFWARIFGINFVIGVVTGIPMEFQFGTNWSAFSKQAGGVIGQPLAMEGVFSFFLESTFLGAFLRRTTTRSTPPLAFRLSGFPGLLDFRILHHRHQCLDAASSRLQPGERRRIFSGKSIIVTDKSMARLAVLAQHDRCGRYRVDGHDSDGRLLSVDASVRKVRQDFRKNKLKPRLLSAAFLGVR
jgi:hypothetical protein